MMLRILFSVGMMSSIAPAQWLHYPTPGIPPNPRRKTKHLCARAQEPRTENWTSPDCGSASGRRTRPRVVPNLGIP